MPGKRLTRTLLYVLTPAVAIALSWGGVAAYRKARAAARVRFVEERRAGCRDSLMKISEAFSMYGYPAGWEAPPQTFGALVATGSLEDRHALECPACTLDEAVFAQSDGGSSDYIYAYWNYIGARFSSSEEITMAPRTAEIPLVYDRHLVHDGIVNVMFTDGHIEDVTLERFSRLLTRYARRYPSPPGVPQPLPGAPASDVAFAEELARNIDRQRSTPAPPPRPSLFY